MRDRSATTAWRSRDRPGASSSTRARRSGGTNPSRSRHPRGVECVTATRRRARSHAGWASPSSASATNTTVTTRNDRLTRPSGPIDGSRSDRHGDGPHREQADDRCGDDPCRPDPRAKAAPAVRRVGDGRCRRPGRGQPGDDRPEAPPGVVERRPGDAKAGQQIDGDGGQGQDRGEPGEPRRAVQAQADDAEQRDRDEQRQQRLRRDIDRPRLDAEADGDDEADQDDPADRRDTRRPGPAHRPLRAPIQPSSSARTASSVRDWRPYRSNSRRRWLSTVFSDSPSRAPTSAFVEPATTSSMTWTSRSDGRRGAATWARRWAALKTVPPAATAGWPRRWPARPCPCPGSRRRRGRWRHGPPTAGRSRRA